MVIKADYNVLTHEKIKERVARFNNHQSSHSQLLIECMLKDSLVITSGDTYSSSRY